MAIKVQFEIGHSATVKSKRTPEGFTHDWELYVQGVNKADISAFVDKVVFNLHDSFPKPKRSFKEPPYVLKESGYAGFVLAIDIYFRNRDEPKRVTFSYDLDLQQEGPPVHRSEVKKFIFEAPSEDFRQKLVKGGGIAVSGVVGGAITADEKSLDMSLPDSRSQMVGKPKLSSDANSTSSSSSSKKHKQRPDDNKNTFANVFGTPITKSAPKFSPDPKTKAANGGAGAPMTAAIVGNAKGGSGKDKANSGGIGAAAGTAATGPTANSGKEKDKSDKKDKHKQQTSPHKEKTHEEKESKKKSDGKHDKREEKKKDKKDKDKDRERGKDKASKRSLSPKTAAVAAPSPKRPSPVRSSSAASRDDPSVASKSSSKSSESEKRVGGSSSSKKSKKEKKSHDKEREHKEKHRGETKESIPVVNAAPPVAVVAPAAPLAAQPPALTSSKVQNPTVASKNDLNSNKNQKSSEKELKKSDIASKTADKEGTPLTSEKKSSTDKDKKSHKHKKKDKNKEKEKEKDKDQPSKKSTGSKEKKEKKDKTAKNEATTINSNANAAISKKSAATPEVTLETPTESGSTKPTLSSTTSKAIKQSNNASMVPITNNTNSSTSSSNTNNMGTSLVSGLLSVSNDLSDVDSESLHTTSNSNSEKAVPIQNSDSSNSSFPDLPAAQQPPVAKPVSIFQAPANPQPTPPLSTVLTPTSTPSILPSAPTVILEPPRLAPVIEKKDHKAHRGAEKTKAEKAAEKEDKKRRRNSTAVNTFVEPPLKQIKKDFNAKTAREKSQSPLLRTDDKQPFLPPPATTSTLSTQNTPVTALNVEYLSELQELHQKIMTLQDNDELQQVVEMIAATGRYEITSKTFDFDLCKLDRHTVQRLQDFFATSVS